MERARAEQVVRDALPDGCQECPRMNWCVPLAVDNAASNRVKDIKAAAGELADDLEANCRNGMRGGLLGIKACQYGVIRQLPGSIIRPILDGINKVLD